MSNEVKKCNCCGIEVDMENDAYVGKQETPSDMDYYLELYNCVCGSTYATKVYKLAKLFK